MTLVVDTHALVWYAGRQTRRLGKGARRAFAEFEAGAETLLVPSPVVLETWFLHKNGTIRVPTTFRAWWTLLGRSGLAHIDLAAEDVLVAAELPWAHVDPFDRLIVAIALRMGCPVLTADGAIADFAGVETVW